jgi:HKD family nuclease
MEIIIIPLTLFLVWLFYIIVRFKHTETKTTLLDILKDTQNPLIKTKVVNKYFKHKDSVRIYKYEKFIFGTLVDTKIKITIGYYSDYDNDDYWI